MVQRADQAFSTLPFDGIDKVSNVFLHDDFIGVEDVADFTDAAGVDLTSTLIWNGSEVAGDSAANGVRVAGVADHPGILRLETGATTPADGDTAALMLGAAPGNDGDGDYVCDDNGLYIASIIRIADVDAQKVEFGLFGQAPAAVNSSAADVISVVWDPEDAANVSDELFLYQVNAGGSDSETAGSLKYVQSDWVLLEIYATDTSAKFRATTEDGSEVVEIETTMPTVALRPGFVVEAVGAGEEVLDIDAFHLRYQRRDDLVGRGNDFLGQ